jgi:FtsZ-binding cell division protein ZapB
MDNAKVFDTLERKIEKLLNRLRALQEENEKLKADLSASRRAEKESGDARGALERMEKDQEVVRQRLQKLIETLEGAEKERS